MRRWLVKVLHVLVNAVIRIRHDISFDLGGIDLDDGPYIFVANHVNNWDPFYLNAPVKKPISFVASERFFKIKPLGFFLELFEAVPKTKFRSDMGTIRMLLKQKAKGRHIGIFPEGRRSWDGKTGAIIFATSKLVKMLKMPVIAVEISGAALAEPRWADYYRKGPILLKYRLILKVEDVESLSADEIHQKLVASLAHDESAIQKSNHDVYRGKRMAEKLERFLFICPVCRQVGMLRSDDDHFRCMACQSHATYSETGLLEGDFGINNPPEWNQWQLDYFRDHLDELLKEGMFRKEADVTEYDMNRNVLSRKRSEVVLSQSGLTMEALYERSRISGVNIQSNDKIEFYIDDQRLIRIQFTDERESVYKWQTALEYIE